MPRIAHVISTPSGFGGAEHVMASLVVGGARRRWDQLVLNPFATDPQSSEISRRCPAARYAGHRCNGIPHLPGTRAWLRGELAVFSPDVVHAHLPHAIALVATLRRTGRDAWLLTHHHGSHLVLERRRGAELVDRAAGLRFDRVVAVSEWGREFLLGRYRYSPERVVTIVNGWAGDPGPWSDGSRPPTVVCVANLRAQKGHDVLLDAFEQVRRAVPDCRLLLVGGGELRASLEERAARLHLGDSVEFLGPVDDVWAQLRRADVFALASRYEPLGIAVMEAMAAGLPVVASATGGIPELVCDGLTGALTPPGDDVAIAAQLVRLLRDPELCRRMGAAGSVAAAGRTMTATVDAYFALYEGLIRSRALRADR